MKIITNASKEYETGKDKFGLPEKQELAVTMELEGPALAIKAIEETLETNGFTLT